MLNAARLERSRAPGNRPWQSFFAWAFGASTIVVLPVFVLAAFYPGLMASWLGIGALAALVGLVQQQTNSSGGVSIAIQLIADTSRSLAAAAQEVAATAAAEATIASDLASRGWAQERMG
jgi:hypothetical protein